MKKALVISAPSSKSGIDFRSFEGIFSSGVGPTYVISDNDIAQLPIGSKVIILDKDLEKRAEAQLTGFTEAGVAGNGQRRRNVHFVKPKMVPYTYERTSYTGVALVDDR